MGKLPQLSNYPLETFGTSFWVGSSPDDQRSERAQGGCTKLKIESNVGYGGTPSV